MYVDRVEKEHKHIRILTEERGSAEKDGEMYKIFTELELEIEGVDNLVWFCFDYMPSSIEIMWFHLQLQ